jgi:signal transduction histidine kinase
MKPSKKSFMGQLIALQVAAMALCWAILLLGLFVVMSRLENGDLDRRMSYFASILAETASASRDKPADMAQRLAAVESVFVNGVIEELESALNYRATYQVLDKSGHVLHAVGAPGQESWSNSRGFGEHLDRGIHYRTVRVESVDGEVAVVVAESDSVRWASVWPMLRLIGASQLAIFIACIVVLFWSGRHVVRPIRDMAASVAGRSSGMLQPVEDQIGYRETAPLIGAFNDLLLRERGRLDTERGFLAEAAHELRTPLAAMMAHVERVMHSKDEAARATSSEQLFQASQRVSHLLSQLLMTARIESSPAFAAIEPVDAAELTRKVLADHVQNARRKRISLSFDGPERSLAMANSLGLHAIVDNLVDNAIRYTQRGGNVQVVLSAEASRIEVLVKDDGPGIAPELHDAVFERFYRVPGVDEDGSGLGLSIVRRLVDFYGGAIALGRGIAGRGVGVSVEFPAAPTTA